MVTFIISINCFKCEFDDDNCFIAVRPKIKYDDKFKEPILVKTKRKTVIDTTLEGVPDVTITWKVDGKKELITEDNVFVEKKPTYSRVTILVTEANQGGDYHLHIENVAGSDDAHFKVEVRGRSLFMMTSSNGNIFRVTGSL